MHSMRPVRGPSLLDTQVEHVNRSTILYSTSY